MHKSIDVVSVSHNQRLAGRMNTKRQKLLNSEKFKFFFPEINLISNTAYSLKDERGGELSAVPMAALLGHGLDIGIIDDLTNAEQAVKAMEEMNNAWDFYQNTLPSRINDITQYALLNVQQRLSVSDITGRIMADPVLSSQYKFIVLPAIFDKKTILVFPITGKIVIFEPGDYLWPERFGDYQALRFQVGESIFQTEYLQKPIASDKAVIKEDMIVEKSVLEVPSIDQADMIYGSHDFPVKDKETSDYLGSLIGYKVKGTLYLIDCLEKRMAFVESINYVKRLSDLHFGIIHVIEDKANGSPILQQLQEEVAGLQAFQPGTQSKMQRLESASYYMPNIVFVQNQFDPLTRTYKLNDNLKNLKDRLIAFPFVEHDDICDAFSMLALFVFMDRRFAVYGRSFNKDNTFNITPEIEKYYSNIFFNKEGDVWKVLDIGIKFGARNRLYVKRELQFKADITEGIKKLKAFAPTKNVFIDCSFNETLYGIFQENVTIETYTPADFEQSVGDLSLAFANKSILVEENCKLARADIENFKYDKSKDENIMKFKTQKDGFVACIRTAINFFGGLS